MMPTMIRGGLPFTSERYIDWQLCHDDLSGIVLAMPARRRADGRIGCSTASRRLQRPVAIFVDEFQTLRNRASLTFFFRDFFDRVPENVEL